MWKYWKSLTPLTRRIGLICLTILGLSIVICATISGSLGGLFNLILETIK